MLSGYGSRGSVLENRGGDVDGCLDGGGMVEVEDVEGIGAVIIEVVESIVVGRGEVSGVVGVDEGGVSLELVKGLVELDGI